MKSLIIGITGCSGSYLAEHLLDNRYEVFGTKRKSSSLNNIQHMTDNITIFDIDLNDEKSIADVIEQSLPDQIYFLVAANHFQDTETIYKTNIQETITFFETLVNCSYDNRIVISSSSAVYGVRSEIYPIDEEDKLLPSVHYGLSKVFQEQIASFYSRKFDLDIIIARPFNFTGPREFHSYVCTDFSKQIVDIENGESEPIMKVGNLQNKRDFTDVRDIVRGYELLAKKGLKGETYNLCSGKTRSIQSILDRLLSMSKVKIEVTVDPNRIRSNTINYQTGNNSKVRLQTGWEPEISLDKTLEDVMIYIRKVN